VPIADFTAGLYAAYSIAAALFKVRGGAPGEHIDVSMLGGMLGIAHLQTSELFGTGREPVALGSAHPMNAPYAAFRCRDGYFALAAGTNKLWEATCAGIGEPELAREERFATPTLRARNQDALRERLEIEFIKRDAAELLAIFRGLGVPCAPINTYSQVLADPQVEHMTLVEEMTLPGGTRSKVVISPQRIGGERLGTYRNPPALGEHTDEVLAEIKKTT
jgi:formyl-CoA transferase